MIFHEWYSLYSGPTEAIKAFNKEFGRSYGQSVIHEWNHGTVNFPQYARKWAREMVLPLIAEDYKLDPKALKKAVNRLL